MIRNCNKMAMRCHQSIPLMSNHMRIYRMTDPQSHPGPLAGLHTGQLFKIPLLNRIPEMKKTRGTMKISSKRIHSMLDPKKREMKKTFLKKTTDSMVQSHQEEEVGFASLYDEMIQKAEDTYEGLFDTTSFMMNLANDAEYQHHNVQYAL
mmetsp:Transcript_14028/g.21239  ORF Transcript_14028/g.21239 Transcript_14028/m.21239 type:complete len:150 (+) Transcript_14028:91-540(+)